VHFVCSESLSVGSALNKPKLYNQLLSMASELDPFLALLKDGAVIPPAFVHGAEDQLNESAPLPISGLLSISDRFDHMLLLPQRSMTLVQTLLQGGVAASSSYSDKQQLTAASQCLTNIVENISR
jgi:hypothetical protein